MKNSAEQVVKITTLVRKINEETAQGFRNAATVALAKELAVEAEALVALAEEEFKA